MLDMKTFMALTGLMIVMFAFGLPALAAEPGRACTMEYAPVCAAKQVQCFAAPCYPVYETYSNACMAGDAPIIHQGACTDKETGPVKPVEPYVPPKGCTAWFDGCNSCSVGMNGQAMCTLMACQEYQTKPGRCTSYEKPKPPVSTGGGSGSGTVSSGTVTPATTTPPFGAFETPQLPVIPPPGFFERIWIWFVNLFS